MRRAYRRPIAKAEVDGPMAFYREGRAEGDFDAGIATALSAVLINPEFLFRVESDPKKVAAGGVYRISDLELASRLSFFLWSSIPDDELLDAADSRQAQSARRSSRSRRAGCSPIARSFNLATQLRRTVAAAAQSRGGQSERASLSRTSTTTCVRRSGRRPSSSSTACCARIAACST